QRALRLLRVLRIRGDRDVRSAREYLRGAAIHTREGEGSERVRQLRVVPLVVGHDRPVRPAGDGQHRRIALAERYPRVGLVAILRRLGRVHESLDLLEAGDRLWTRELRVPRVAVAHRDVAAVLPDEWQGVVPVLAGEPHAGHPGRFG